MKGLTRNQYNSFICTAVIGFNILMGYTVDGSCLTKLIAMRTPSTENFTEAYEEDRTSTDKNKRCLWVIKSAVHDFNVKLTFPIFRLRTGDCIEIFDGSDDDDSVLLDKLCDKVPKKSYISRKRELLVIYDRGDLEGDRHFSMTYSFVAGFRASTLLLHTQTTSSFETWNSSTKTWTSKTSSATWAPSRPQKSSTQSHVSSSPSSLYPQSSSAYSSDVAHAEKIIKVVGIIGAVLAGGGLIFLVLKATKCCKCLRKNSNDTRRVSNYSRETVGLTRITDQGGRNNRNMHIITNNSNVSQPLSPQVNNVAGLATVSETGEAATDTGDGSDTDSLQAMDELPPSYESLYLDELGEPVSPPRYSPPAHRSTHPPRRVHTFN